MIALFAALLAVVTAPYAPVSYACDGTTANFTVTFPYIASTDLSVTSTTAGGAVTTLVLTTDFVTLNSTTSTATLTILVPATKCPAGSTLKISRTMSCTQPTSFRQQTSFNPGLVETTTDRVLMCAQQVQAQVSSTQNLSFSSQNTFTATQTFSPATSDAIVAQGGGTGRGVVASSGATSGVAAQFTTGNAINAPVQIVPQASDPSTPANGEMWVNSTINALKVRAGGATYQITGNPLVGANTAAGQSIPNSTYTAIVFGSVEIDTDAAYTSGTGVFTVPAGKGGHYEITASTAWALANAASATLSIFKGGVIQKEFQLINFGAAASLSVTAILNLAAGNTIDIRAWQNSGGARSLEGTAAHNFVAIKRISE